LKTSFESRAYKLVYKNLTLEDTIVQSIQIMSMESSAEKFQPRGIGLNWIACFVCYEIKDGYSDLIDGKPGGEVVKSIFTADRKYYRGGYGSVQADMSSFVTDRAAGKRVVEMFAMHESSAYLDFRLHEPNYVQVKIGACERHLPNLRHLQQLTQEANHTISPSIIRSALLLGTDNEPSFEGSS